MQDKVYIIVPVYNMEQYLRKCVDSLLAQTYKNVQIVLVDDGSKDNSPAICDEYASAHENVQAVHKINGGLSDARNAGLDLVKGGFVTFVDADDYLEIDAVQTMADALETSGADVAYMQCNFVNEAYEIVKIKGGNTREITVFNSEEYVEKMCLKQKSESVCDKLFPARLFENRRFEKGRLNEDFFFLSKLLFESLTIAEVDYAGYNYYHRTGSISRSGFGKSLVDAVVNCLELMDLAKAQKPQLEKSFAYLALFQARTALLTMPFSYVKQKREEYWTSLRCVKACMPFLPAAPLSKKDKLFVKWVAKNPVLTLRCTSILWKIKRR